MTVSALFSTGLDAAEVVAAIVGIEAEGGGNTLHPIPWIGRCRLAVFKTEAEGHSAWNDLPIGP